MMLWKCVHSLRPSSGLAVQRLLRLQQSARLQKKSPLQSLTCRGIRSDTALSGNTAVSAQLQAQSQIVRKDDVVAVKWSSDGSVENFPAVWLRDNCQCEQCFHPVSKARKALMKDLDFDIRPKDVWVEKGEVVVAWPDGHVSCFTEAWLRDRAFTDENVKRRREQFGRRRPEFFNASYADEMRTFEYRAVMEEDREALNWLRCLEVHGLVRVSEVPEFTLQKLLDRAGFARKTHYLDVFEVKSKGDPNNLAYTSGTLGLHVDLPYYKYTPGTQFLHCMKQFQMKGAENEFVDGFAVADFIRRYHPEEWHILTNFKVDFWDVGEEETIGPFHKVGFKPVIELDQDGELFRINYSDEVRDSHLSQPLDVAKKIYKALKLFNSLIYHRDNMFVYKMKEGECLVFDNQRVLHSRRGFSAEEGGGERFVQGAYVDWDEVKSTINVLSARLESTA